MGQQSYVLLCSEIIKSMTWFGRFCIQFVTSSKVKFFQNPFSHILETSNIYFLKIGGGCHDALKIYIYAVKSSNL